MMKKLLLSGFLFCSAVSVMAQVQKAPKTDTHSKDSVRVRVDLSKTTAPQKVTSASGMPFMKPEDSIRYSALKGPKRNDSLYHIPNRKINSYHYEVPKTVTPGKLQEKKSSEKH